jgi:hypothetical protein
MATITDYIDGNGKAVQRTDYSQPSTPQPDKITLSYNPPDPQQSRGWAFNEAVGAAGGALLISVFAAPLAGMLAAWAGAGVGIILLTSLGSFVLPLAWPIAAYRAECSTWGQTSLDYHEATIERLRHQPTPAPTVAGARTATPEPGEMFYLQCAAVLARATVDPRSPRDAESAVRMTTKSGVPIVVTKDDYDTVAGMLCELGFMVGGKGQTPRNYALAQAWQGKSVNELWAALKEHKAVIMAWAV